MNVSIDLPDVADVGELDVKCEPETRSTSAVLFVSGGPCNLGIYGSNDQLRQIAAAITAALGPEQAKRLITALQKFVEGE